MDNDKIMKVSEDYPMCLIFIFQIIQNHRRAISRKLILGLHSRKNLFDKRAQNGGEKGSLEGDISHLIIFLLALYLVWCFNVLSVRLHVKLSKHRRWWHLLFLQPKSTKYGTLLFSEMILIKCLIKLNFEPGFLLSGERFHCCPAGEKQLYSPPLNRYLNLSRKGK